MRKGTQKSEEVKLEMNLSLFTFATLVWLLPAPSLPMPSLGVRPLNGTCYNSNNLGARGSFLAFELGQAYPEGDGLLFLRTVDPKPQGDTYAVDVSSVTPEPGACLPENCAFSATLEEFEGLGSTLQGMSPRELSNKLHSTPTTSVNDIKEETEVGISSILTFFGQFAAHDILGLIDISESQLLLPFAGFPNLNDTENPFVRAGYQLKEDDSFIPNVAQLGPPLNFQFPTFGVFGFSTERIEDANTGELMGINFKNARTAHADLDGLYGMGDAVSDIVRANIDGNFLLQDYTFPLFGPPGSPPGSFTVPDLPPPASLLPQEIKDANRINIELATETIAPIAADFRNTISIHVFIIQLAFVRFHNHMAQTQCGQCQGTASEIDECKFQCARRITIATYQHIVYSDYLGVLTGEDFLTDYNGYDPNADPSLTVEANIAGRFHFAQPGRLPLAQPGDCTPLVQFDPPPIPGNPTFGDPPAGFYPFGGLRFAAFPVGAIPFVLGFPAVITGEDQFLQAIQGMTCSEVPAFNEVVDNLVRNQPVGPGGVDVPASTLFRHEHLGVKSFHEVRKAVLGKNVYGEQGCSFALEANDNADDPWRCFDAFVGDKTRAKKLRAGLKLAGQDAGVKAKVKFLPLWTGLVYEEKETGSLLGKTQHAILVAHLRRVRDADPFFYKLELNPQELAMVEGTSLADILRVAFDPLNTSGAIQDDVFHV